MFTYTNLLRVGLLALAVPSAVSCVSQLDGIEGRGDPLIDGTAQTSAAPIVVPASSDTIDAEVMPPPPDCPGGAVNSEGYCVHEARCAPGTFRAEFEGTAVCAPCESGAFSATSNAVACVLWKTCIAGEFVETQGSSSSDRVCAACPDGATSSVENAGECNGATDCMAGEYKSGDACVSCSPGTYCSGNSTEEIPCEAGTWDNDGQPGTPCIVATDCTAGQYVLEAGTTTVDRNCEFCTEGTFSTEDNASSCTQASDCAAGSYVAIQSTSSTDRECTACEGGTFSSSPNSGHCEPWSTCLAPAAFSASEPTLHADRVCEPCPAGQSAETDNVANCVPNTATNGDFESDAMGWVTWNGATVATSTAKAYTGTHSLLVTGPGTGPAALILNSVAQAGTTYDLSFWVSVGNVSSTQVNLTRALGCGGAPSGYEWVANNPSVSNSDWTNLTGSFTIPTDCNSPKLTIYAEGGGENVDLYVDNVLIQTSP